MDIKSIAHPIISIKTNGKYDKIQAYEFLELFEKAAVANSWNDQLKLNQVECCLEGEAQICFTTITRENHTKLTWCQFKREYLQHVCKIDTLQLKEGPR
jgi:hypothetical protein